MKILWISNVIFPEAQSLLTGKGELKASGGWMLGAADALVRQPEVTLIVASISSDVTTLTKLEGEKIIYYLLPYGKGNKKVNHDYEPMWRKVHDEVQPDIVHIHGTEYSHGLAYLNACGNQNVCVSIQGLTSVSARYYLADLTSKEIRKAWTPACVVRGNIFDGAKEFKVRGEIERETLRRVHHIIGRTSWDKAHAWAVNPEAEYHHGGETLRSDFYSGTTWSYDKCTPHSIFLSQAGMPLKGLHQVLRAMPLVLRHFPDATVRIAGNDISCSRSWKDVLKLRDYGNIVRKLIRQNKLNKCVTFTGRLDGKGMRHEYLRSNVFVCPSSIENSPNSLGEAQILGVPVLSSYVGGAPDMMRGDEEHLYRFEEVEMLAHKIVSLFNQGNKIDTEAMRQEALRRHNPKKNVKELMLIYQFVVQS